MAMARPYVQLAKAAERRLLPLNLGLTSALILSRLASAPDSQRMSDLATYVEVEPQSITSLVDRLERVGFVRREKHPTDRRAIVLAVTDEGREIAERIDDALLQTLRDGRAGS
jgi:DNA-binding MarR family transcriptional regulator